MEEGSWGSQESREGIIKSAAVSILPLMEAFSVPRIPSRSFISFAPPPTAGKRV